MPGIRIEMPAREDAYILFLFDGGAGMLIPDPFPAHRKVLAQMLPLGAVN